MKLYRYLSKEELEKIQAGEIEKIGFFYNDRQKFKRVNSHRYKKDVKYLHFYFDKKEISRIKSASFKSRDICYVCEFNIPFYVILPYIGIGVYESKGYGHQGLNLAVFHHINELMRVKFHFVIGGAGSAAFSALHTFTGIDTADAKNGLLQIFLFHPSLLIPDPEPQREAR